MTRFLEGILSQIRTDYADATFIDEPKLFIANFDENILALPMNGVPICDRHGQPAATDHAILAIKVFPKGTWELRCSNAFCPMHFSRASSGGQPIFHVTVTNNLEKMGEIADIIEQGLYSNTAHPTVSPVEHFNRTWENCKVYSASGMLPFHFKGLESLNGDDQETLYIRAPMKLGKSEAVFKHLEAIEYKPKSVLFITFRKLFARDLKCRLEDFVLYTDLHPTEALTAAHLIVQFESLGRIRRFEPWDLVICDESESISEQASSNLTKNGRTLPMFYSILQRAKRVICMDANLGFRTRFLMKHLRLNATETFIENLWKNGTENKFYHTVFRTTFYKKLQETLDFGPKTKNIVIPTNSLKAAKEIKLFLTSECGIDESTIGFYSGKTPDDRTKNEHFSNVNKHWKNYRVLIYTPVITAGISFVVEHYDVVFALFGPGSTSVESSRQMLHRIRNVKDKQYYLCFEGFKPHRLPTEFSAVKRYLTRLTSDMFTPFKGLDSTWLHRSIDDNGRLTLQPDDYYFTFVLNMMYHHYSLNDFQARFIAQEEDTGAKFESLDGTEEERLFKMMLDKDEDNLKVKEVKQEVKSQLLIAIASASNLTLQGYETLLAREKRQDEISVEENHSVSKYEIRSWYQIPVDTPVTVDFLEKYLKRNIFQAFRAKCRHMTMKAEDVLRELLLAESQAVNDLAAGKIMSNVLLDQSHVFATHVVAFDVIRLCDLQPAWLKLT